MRCDPFTLKVGIFKGFKGKLSLCCLTTIWYHNVLNVISIVTSYRVVNDELFVGVVLGRRCIHQTLQLHVTVLPGSSLKRLPHRKLIHR